MLDRGTHRAALPPVRRVLGGRDGACRRVPRADRVPVRGAGLVVSPVHAPAGACGQGRRPAAVRRAEHRGATAARLDSAGGAQGTRRSVARGEVSRARRGWIEAVGGAGDCGRLSEGAGAALRRGAAADFRVRARGALADARDSRTALSGAAGCSDAACRAANGAFGMTATGFRPAAPWLLLSPHSPRQRVGSLPALAGGRGPSFSPLPPLWRLPVSGGGGWGFTGCANKRAARVFGSLRAARKEKLVNG